MAPEFKHLTVDEKKAVEENFATESDFMAAYDFYSNPTNRQFRKLAVSAIATHCEGIEVDAFVPYLAMNYFDRFVSNSKKPYSDIEEVHKVAITCLFIAAKERDNSDDFFPETITLDFDIEGIEHQIYDELPWETPYVTPFYFLDYFYPPFEEIGGFRRRHINEIIVQAQGEDDFIKYNYKPSEIALSSLRAAANIAYPSFRLPDKQLLLHDKLAFCVKKLVDLCTEQNIMIESASSSSATVVEEIEEEDEADLVEMFTSEAPKRLMNFYLQWPTNIADR